MEYVFTIRDKNYAGFKKLASLLFLANAVIFASFALNTDGLTPRIIFAASALLLLIYAVYSWYRNQEKDKYFIPLYLLAAFVWILDTAYWYFAIVLLLLLILQFKMQKTPVIIFAEKQVQIEGFTVKTFPWDELDNVVLKDGLLTLDFTSNKILHAEPDQYERRGSAKNDLHLVKEDYGRFESEFNEFCQRQLRST